MTEGFSQAVYRVVMAIPQGYVATYGMVAQLAGRPRTARMVGGVLHRNPQPGVIPCHRVVFRDGSLAPGFAFGGPGEQQALLEQECVRFIAGDDSNAGAAGMRVDLQQCLWDGRMNGSEEQHIE
ncbi:MGMT family protein [Bifidobacterium gallicum]|uniref:6-O-methylguanine DNA methyltransferase, DNA binding domain protein n=1 Tax=Bifidobacterium gallicum DSM 20093 = LMG 11596 TaxID=561180 RepID=D1NU36_9BIFI|nr:MGMT family protein [Bifidobacterium gallicum]EFA23240.1 6-O-methylguanine DNA methyltransferase, DNA binding domain protein [Bifidobacterium gallicum DSM 20093 = LMG 11596]KFI58900.1 methylated-DNA--protein-cysteine methyltransferase [Bifidobacterium gallicum DSM 20093 = LMG 11596]